jgi:hypothetical protein
MSEAAGVVERLEIEAGPDGAPARYRLHFADGQPVCLNDKLGRGLVLRHGGLHRCRHCGTEGRRSFGNGYCYSCFTTLARCDLCVVSPDRCHYHQGTCREPAWGESFCMQPHLVYLANSSGIKVGLTRQGREIGRWLDQGAIQGLRILNAASRRAAGLAEVEIARRLPDRTDWRRMLRPDVPELDLAARVESLADLELPQGVVWAVADEVERLHYPLPDDLPALPPLRLDPATPVSGNLLGMKGQYLALSSGALHVGRCLGQQISLAWREPFDDAPAAGQQLGLF